MQENRFARPCLCEMLVLLAALLLARSSGAQGSDSALAEALFKDARALMNAGKIDEACPKFAESQRLVPKLGTLLNLATCHDKQGKTGSAWDEYTQAITLAKQAGESEREQYARRELERVESRLSKLVVRVTSPIPDLEVRVDGRLIGEAAWGTPIPLDPGEHRVEARAEGHSPWQQKVTMPKGPAEVPVEIPALAVDETAAGAPADEPAAAPKSTASAPTLAEPEPGSSSAQSTAGWVLGGLGIVGIGIGTGFGINTFIQQGESDEHCVETACDQEGVDLRSAAKTSAVVSDVAFAVGAAALLTGIILLVTDGSDETPDAGTDSGAPRAWLTIGAATDGGALELGARF